MQTQGSHSLLYSLYGFLLIAVLVSAVTDLRSRRIPNLVTYPTVILALSVYGLYAGLPGVFFSLKGLGFGFALLLVPYLLGGMGAGDVKLMAAVGSVLGVRHTFVVFLIIAVIGGVAALAMLAARRQLLLTLRQIVTSFQVFCSGAGIAALKVDRTKLQREGIPYGAVIACGTVVFFVFQITAGEGLPGIAI